MSPLNVIAVRKEDKNRWERRAPLTPDHVAQLVREQGISIRVEPASRRAFPDVDYTRAGAELSLDLHPAKVILGVKEVPVEKILPEKVYVFFSHVIKGQDYNMPMLRALMERGCTLIDYEPIADAKGRRLIFFGRHAGYAGMLDTLWALGQRLRVEGFETPFEELRPALQYSSLDEATSRVAHVGHLIRRQGLPTGLRPVVFAFTGSGNVSQGAQEVFDRLPFETIDPEALPGLPEDRDRPRNVVYKTILERHHRVERAGGGPFDARELDEHPERYRSALGPLLPHITVFVNGIYWDPRHPRLISIADLDELWKHDPQPKLRVIGDITCDIGGSIEATVEATTPGEPIFVYDLDAREKRYGAAGRGPVIMSVDNLPSELPVEASEHFGDSLLRFVPVLARCDWTRPFEELELPHEIRRAVIVHEGKLTPDYQYLTGPLEAAAP